ncbi:tubby-related protein 4-like isoform X2 [Octopus sinensis]|uniref:Tubby-related protein 4-like isoform X2 n=1 Tax=Octopus sinensis TaxID=2607531 RepID=A0A6P7S7R7_9MOLL|nr:tubby-related protein 4-like isoform X2 [Octopus sinensis]
MHVHFEQNNSTRCDCTVQCLSWMGKVPDGIPDADCWKLNRAEYYMEGWLASGNASAVVGVTFTTSHCRKYDAPTRSNFNLRGHRSEVVLVRWNEPYQKLATCDAHGIIFVWIKHEGRWSIELINDRNSKVTDFAWSHDGRMALICYWDGFVLVGSVAGQRYWSSMLNLDNASITCGVWSPDDQKVMFGTSDGQIIVMSSTGAMLTQVMVLEGAEIGAMSWSCEKFNMDEAEANKTEKYIHPNININKSYTLALSFKVGTIYLMSTYDDVCPRIIHTKLTGVKMDWSNCGEYLAVAGFVRLPNLYCRNELHFYSKDGKLLHRVVVPSQGRPVTALTWGHNDRRLFIASGCEIYVAWISKIVPPLQFYCQRTIQKAIREENKLRKLPLPSKLRNGVKALFSPTVKSYIPDPFKLREFVSIPPPGNERLYCTMLRHGEETSGGHYTLYLEYLGGLVPLLKGKRTSKLRPDFVIFDPKIKTFQKDDLGQIHSTEGSSDSDSDTDISADGCGSPRMQRRKRQKHFRAEKVERSITFRTLDELLYNDNLPENNRLVQVSSNIWGTKFGILGVAHSLPEDLGQVLYKTSLLHLQPRQMTVTVTELLGDTQALSRDPNFTPAGCGEEDEDGPWLEIVSVVGGATVPDVSIIPESSIDPNSRIAAHYPMEPFGTNSIGNHIESPIIIDRESLAAKSSEGPNFTGFPANKTNQLQPAKISQVSMNPRDIHFETANNCIVNSNSSDGVISKDGYQCLGARPKVPTNANPPKITLDTGQQSLVLSEGSKQPKTELEEILRTDMSDDMPRWADPARQSLRYIDDEGGDNSELPLEANTIQDCSQLVPVTARENQPRLYFAHQDSLPDSDTLEKPSPFAHYYRTSIDSTTTEDDSASESTCSPHHSPIKRTLKKHGSVDTGINILSDSVKESTLNRGLSSQEIKQSASLPSSPVRRSPKMDTPTRRLREEVLRGKSKHYSPVLGKKQHRYLRLLDSSEEDLSCSADENAKVIHSFKDLESFQKAQLRQKAFAEQLNRNSESMEQPCKQSRVDNWQEIRKARRRGEPRRMGSSTVCAGRQFVMYNKAPLWNEGSQVYQLDFGGRVTQESAKNFQIEFRGRQVMQFGRIDSNAYTLDFQYPFTALQAFAVALANVTQRLK